MGYEDENDSGWNSPLENGDGGFWRGPQDSPVQDDPWEQPDSPELQGAGQPEPRNSQDTFLPESPKPQNTGDQDSQGGYQNNQGVYQDNQGGNYQTQYQTQYQKPSQEKNTMATIALVMGILSLLSSCCLRIGLIFVFGILGIIFALISKKGDRMEDQARAGLIMSVIGIILAVLILVLILSLSAVTVLPGLGVQE